MRKFLFLLLTAMCVLLNAQEETRSRFTTSYYSGDYEQAHRLLNDAVSDPLQRQIWDDRLHWMHTFSDCSLAGASTPATRGTALLRIGLIDMAQQHFEEDWLSLLGRATIHLWQNRASEGRTLIKKALELSPEQPEVVYAAGNLAPTSTLALELFRKYVDLVKDDPYKQAVAE